MNIITIDQSLTCTALIVNDKKFVYAADHVALTKTGKTGKWFEIVDQYITLRLHSLKYDKTLSHSGLELAKIDNYLSIIETIMKDIFDSIDPSIRTKCYIEGYSYASEAGPLIDLVTLGTLIRMRFIKEFGTVCVVTPTELKMFTARFTYPVITGKKNEVIKNKEGVSGGRFQKPDMMKALVENTTLQCEWVNFLRNVPTDMSAKVVPKPIEDLNDAKLMYEIAKSNKYF